MINFDIIKHKLARKLNDERRFSHCLLVAQKTNELIKQHNLPINPKEAYLAGLVHDYAKNLSLNEFQEIIEKNNLSSRILNEPFALLHAFLGIYIIKEELGISNPQILEAIYFHPVGNKNMNPLTEVLFLADFIEDSRDYEICTITRKVAIVNYKKALAKKIQYLINTQKEPHHYTKEAFKDYQKYLKE